ncbi:MAG: DUF2357 domain-containing protein [Saprospiraceae bacterium]|nr:DUF2357 domain-containing protein [Saprospiraceae bacterium]
MSAPKFVITLTVAEKNIEIVLCGENSSEPIIEKADAIENGEAIVQIKEGSFYEYKITDGYSLQTDEIVSQSNISKSSGRISPNIYVGTLSIDVLKSDTKQKCGEIKLEVQSVKTTYREDYRHMLEEITEKCTDLLLQHSSPVAQFFEIDFNADAVTLYQRFAFIKSIIESVEFNDSVHKILSSPVTRWRESKTVKEIRSVRRFNNSTIRQLSNATNRFDLPAEHPLKSTMISVPSKLNVSNKSETVDTPENRFVKHALMSFQSFCSDFKTKVKDSDRIKTEAALLEDKLEQYLSHSIFKEISSPTTLSLNSPVLQRKEGYREILRVWLMFDLAAKMVWKGGDDVYRGSKRDVAVLYEYWLFFKLLDIVKEVFKIESVATENLIEKTSDGLGLKLKQGKFLPVKGIYLTDTRKLNIEFSYNKTFSGGNEYPAGGSWTRNLRPDYTLSIWPFGIEQEQAEKEELIVHIHFDAKYKVENLQGIFGKDDNLEEEKEEQKKGTYKRADLLKMHTYKDAIRRTAGAYVLYPGNDNSYARKGFHELIPGLGAFSIRPSKTNNGCGELKRFLLEVLNHFMNRASQREKISLKTYETYFDKNSNKVNDVLPEAYGSNRTLLPDETYVLIGFYDDTNVLNWIEKTRLYNFRTGTYVGSLPLGVKETSAKYLLLRSHGESKRATRLYKLKNKGPKIFSNEDLKRKKYPHEPNGELYLVYELDDEVENEFKKFVWDITKLAEYKTHFGSARPFSISLTELMNVVVK